MQDPFESLDQAFDVLADEVDPSWGAAFALFASQPEKAQLMLDTFAETLEQLGVPPSGFDPASGQPAYSLDDVSRALGVPGGRSTQGADQSATGQSV
jgi:hypothetical protein